MLERLRSRQSLALLVALAAAAVLVIAPPPTKATATPLVSAAQAWPTAKRAALNSALADGMEYDPYLFLPGAKTSLGSARTKDGKSLRLLMVTADGKITQLRSLPTRSDPSFPSFTLDGTTAIWVESTTGHQELWAADTTNPKPRRITTDMGDARFYQSQYDLLVAQGQVYWVAATPDDTTQVRSVALSGGAVTVRVEQGSWSLSAWPWMVNGVVDSSGTTLLRDVLTNRDVKVPTDARGVTACSPVWCQITSLTRKGTTAIQLVRPDGTDRRAVADGTAATVIADVAVLDRFEVASEITSTSELTGNVQLLIYDIKTRRTVEAAPDAFGVTYRAGVLWWSTGSQQSYLRHALDLRTI